MRGGLQMNASGMAWLLMRALSLPAELVDRLLPVAGLGGRLPQQEDELQELMGRIRWQGHVYETRPTGRQGATEDPGAYFFPVFEGPTKVILNGLPMAPRIPATEVVIVLAAVVKLM